MTLISAEQFEEVPMFSKSLPHDEFLVDGVHYVIGTS